MTASVSSWIGLRFHTNLPCNLLTYSSHIIPWVYRLTFQTLERVSEVMSRASQNAYQITLYLFWDLKQGAIKGTFEKSNVRLQQTIFQLTGTQSRTNRNTWEVLNSAQHTKCFRNIIAFKCILKCVLKHAVQVQLFYVHSRIFLHKKGIDENYLAGASWPPCQRGFFLPWLYLTPGSGAAEIQ